MDGIFAAKSQDLQIRCFQWRTNSAFRNKKCVDGQKFVRNHLDFCLWDLFQDKDLHNMKIAYQESAHQVEILQEIFVKRVLGLVVG